MTPNDDEQKAAPDAGSRREILAALASAMSQVQKVAKESRNKHDGYNFASIDDFLALVNPICAQNGLLIHMDEGPREDFERQGRAAVNSWMRQTFNITLMHVSGETLPPVSRTVEVLRNGAQAYGSAQSYALKQFWRCTLLIPTGDADDADHQPTDAGPVTRRGTPVSWRAPDPEAVSGAASSLAVAHDLDALKAIWEGLPKEIQRMPTVIAAKDARKDEMENPPICNEVLRTLMDD